MTPPFPADIYRKDDRLIILVPLAGLHIADLSLTITDDILTIQGERKPEEKVQTRDYFSQECFWGKFKRSVVIPVPVHANQVIALYKKGVLRVEVPIAEEGVSRVAPIQS